MLVILVGKSGCGKSSAEAYFDKMISFTTRPKRDNEVHGADYYFYPKEVVEEAIQRREKGEDTFIEQLSSYLGHHYGTSTEEVERIKGLELVVAVMNMEGAQDMKRIMRANGVDAVIAWVDIEEEVRIQRMEARGIKTGENETELRTRWNEDYRNEEREQADVCIDNNGTMEAFVEKIRAIGTH